MSAPDAELDRSPFRPEALRRYRAARSPDAPPTVLHARSFALLWGALALLAAGTILCGFGLNARVRAIALQPAVEKLVAQAPGAEPRATARRAQP
jgi:hypothetical protein